MIPLWVAVGAVIGAPARYVMDRTVQAGTTASSRGAR